MERTSKKQGFTILEIILSIVIGSGILAAIVALYQPFLKEFNEAVNFQRLRHHVVNPLDALRIELSNAKAIYVDSNLCYAFCSVDRTTGNRILYYWSGNDLLRKSETGTQSISCSNGILFAKNLDKTNSFFSVYGGLFTAKLAVSGTNGSSFSAQTSVFPTLSERHTLLYDGFGCNTESGFGWSLEDTGTLYWKIQPSSGASGAYWLQETLRSNQATPVTATAQIAADLSRVSSAYLQFKYRTRGTMVAGETLTVNFYDGTWHQIFVDDLGGSISSLSTTTVDLSSYTLGSNNILRFDGTLSQSSHHWVIDEIEILAK